MLRWLLLVPAILFAGQKDCERQVYGIAKKFTNYPSTIVAIAYTESSCGKAILGDDGKSLGIMQIQVKTARDIIRWNPKNLGFLMYMPDKQLETMLLTNVYVQVQMASLLFEHHRVRHGYFGALSRYNGGKNNVKYYNKVERNKRWYVRNRYNDKN